MLSAFLERSDPSPRNPNSSSVTARINASVLLAVPIVRDLISLDDRGLAACTLLPVFSYYRLIPGPHPGICCHHIADNHSAKSPQAPSETLRRSLGLSALLHRTDRLTFRIWKAPFYSYSVKTFGAEGRRRYCLYISIQTANVRYVPVNGLYGGTN